MLDRNEKHMSEQVWLPLIRSQSNQPTLGEAILRLANLASASHMQQTADGYQRGDRGESSDVWAEGPAPRDVVAVDIDGEGHTEVNL